MNVAIHQPDYIPWLGLFYKMYLSDVFIHLDDAQYSNEAAHNFNADFSRAVAVVERLDAPELVALLAPSGTRR